MAHAQDEQGSSSKEDVKPENTASLLERARHGDEAARNRLVLRLMPGFRRWAHGRLPTRARALIDTDDLVQVTLVKALKHLSEFEPRHDGAFMGYLRSILLNEIRQEIRRCARRPQHADLSSGFPDDEASPLETLVGRETLDAYEAALGKLSEVQRDAVLLRLELQLTYDEIAEAIGSPSANAARMLIKRALLRLAEEMEHAR